MLDQKVYKSNYVREYMVGLSCDSFAYSEII